MTIKKYKINNVKCVEFDSLSEQLEYILPNLKSNMYDIKNEINSNLKWNGNYTLDQTIEGMQYGFASNTLYFLDCITNIRSQDGIKEGLYLDTEGFVYDMGSVVSGIPECCLNIGIPTINPCIKIMVDVSFDCSVPAKDICNRGIAIANLVNTLLINNYIVELYFIMYNNQSDMDVMSLLKVDTKVLPISTIAFVSSVDYFRKICFCTMDVIRDKQSNIGRGTSRMQKFILDKLKKDDIFFIGGSYENKEQLKHIKDVNNANKYILKLFKKFCDEHKIIITFK